MATARSILAAQKAAPAGRPTPAPQGSMPYFGSPSPMVPNLDTMNGYSYTNAYGNFLPRPPATFTQGAFGPFSPILPVPVDTPTESGRPRPRRTPYEVGWDLPTGEPGTEGLKLATFGTLRTLADLYSVARACIQTRKTEIRGLEWEIMPTPDATKAHKGDSAWYRDFGQRQMQAKRFFRRPDPDYFSWNTFIDALLEEIFVFDALSLYTRRKRGKGMRKGLLGSDLDSLELLSGPTIRPLYGIHGNYPRPPAPAYQQYLYGVPRADFMQLVTGRDIEESGMSEALWGQYAGDQLLYLPMVPRRWTPYGFPPIERAMIPVLSGLQKQGWALDYFREGTVPAVYMSPGDETMTPNQIRELQDALNAFAGDPAFHHKIIVLPPGTKVEPQRGAELADAFDEVIMNQVCMAFDVMPMELGISPKVSTTMSPGASNQMAKMTQSKSDRKSTKPLLMFLGDICNAILQDICGQDDMRFVFEGLEDEEDQEQLTGIFVQQVTNGLRSVDEARDELGLPPWGLPETSGPVFLAPTGPIPFQLAAAQAKAALEAAQHPPGTQPPGGGPGEEPGGASGTSAPKPKPSGGGGASDASTSSGNTPGHAAAEGSDSEAGRQGSRGASTSGAGAGATPQAGQQAAAGRQGGSSSSAAGASSSTSSKMVVTVGAERAITAELESLARHLRKGRQISSWEARNIPPRTMALISENLAKGLPVDQAVAVAKIVTIDKAIPAPSEPAPEPPPDAPTPQQEWPGWARDLALAAVYTPLLLAAFRAATPGLRTTLARARLGSVSTTRPVLEAMLAEHIGEHLGPVLENLWREAWLLGDHSASALISGTPADWGGWMVGHPNTAHIPGEGAQAYEHAMASYGPATVAQISATRVGDLTDALAAGQTPEQLAAAMTDLLDATNRANLIAQAEVGRVSGMGALARYGIAGVTKVEWLAEPDACAACRRNAAAGPIDVGDVFPSGAPAPLQHPHCRCALAPMAFAGELGAEKLMRRSILLTGEEVHGQAPPPEPNAAGGGGRSPVRHWGDGTEAPEGVPVTGGVPGSTAGGEPPRWDTPVANGYQGGWHDDFSSGPNPAQGVAGGDDGRQPYNDRPVDTRAAGREYPGVVTADHWPEGGHGTQQPPGVVIPDDPTGHDRSAWGVRPPGREKFDALEPRAPDGQWITGALHDLAAASNGVGRTADHAAERAAGDLDEKQLQDLSRDYIAGGAAGDKAEKALKSAGYSPVAQSDGDDTDDPVLFAKAMALYKQVRLNSGGADPTGAAKLTLYSPATISDIGTTAGQSTEEAAADLAFFDKSSGSLVLSTDLLKGAHTAQIVDDARQKWFTPDAVEHPVEHQVNHEYGHALANRLTAEQRRQMLDEVAHALPMGHPFYNDRQAEDNWFMINRVPITLGVSQYGATLPDETIAELYASSVLDPSPSPAAQVVHRHLTAMAP